MFETPGDQPPIDWLAVALDVVFAVRVCGSSSLDMTRQGIDKAYGMHRFAMQSGIAMENMIFRGDAIYPGGNDDAVRPAGVESRLQMGSFRPSRRFQHTG